MGRLDLIRHWIESSRSTLLGVGPMSKNCVDVSIDVARTQKIPLLLIASRRQIECSNQGGGYVHRWSTEEFADYVRQRDPDGYIFLARDHGGPWQSSPCKEQHLPLDQAMRAAKESYSVDIESGFDFLHIDPSLDPVQKPSLQNVLERAFELYEHCVEHSKKYGQEIFFEVGTDETDDIPTELDEFEFVLESISSFCERRKFPRPVFIVANTGTKVRETENVGCFHQVLNTNSLLNSRVRNLLQLCQRFQVWLKEHNGDYLSVPELGIHTQLGIHAVNVAPEFGVEETRALCSYLDAAGLQSFKTRFLELSYSSGLWKKWLKVDSTADDEQRAILSGHYIFAQPEFSELKKEIIHESPSSLPPLDEFLQAQIRRAILKYIWLFRAGITSPIVEQQRERNETTYS